MLASCSEPFQLCYMFGAFPAVLTVAFAYRLSGFSLCEGVLNCLMLTSKDWVGL